MNAYEVRVILNVIASNDEDAEEKVRESVKEDLVEIDDVHILSSEIYN